MIKEDFKHVVFHCPTTKKALEHTLNKFNLGGHNDLKIKELVLWKFIYNEHGVRQYNEETVLKTITSLFLTHFIKTRHTANLLNDLNVDKITDYVVKFLSDLRVSRPTCHISRAISREDRLVLLLESGFSPHP